MKPALRPLLLAPRRQSDSRGWFSEIFHDQRLNALGITQDFVQDNQSRSNRKGTIRGLHFQAPPAAQAKLVTVTQGRILDVIVDIRSGSPTFGHHIATELDSATGHLLYVPEGYAHGFMTLVDDVVVTYKVSHHYSPSHEGGLRWNDPQINVAWPFHGSEITASVKDDNLPLLREFQSPFVYENGPFEPIGDPIVF
jgi:dTDP-4-dehydrorhamnose 3,5-epimerase